LEAALSLGGREGRQGGGNARGEGMGFPGVDGKKVNGILLLRVFVEEALAAFRE
jgi:hypothetical protein